MIEPVKAGKPKPTARIEDWVHHGDHLMGNISENPEFSFPANRAQVTTSVIRFFDDDAGAPWAETENTLYQLGSPHRKQT